MPYPTAFTGYQPSQNSFPYPPQAQTQMQTQQGFSVRPVASREEAMAIPSEFFGPGVVMPCLGQGVIFLKRFNQNTGLSDLLEFVYAPPQPPRQESEWVPMDLFRQLCQKVEALEKGAINGPDE